MPTKLHFLTIRAILYQNLGKIVKSKNPVLPDILVLNLCDEKIK